MTHRTHTAAELIKKELAGLTNGVLRTELGGNGGVEQQDEEETEEEPDHGLVVLRHCPHRGLRSMAGHRRRRRRRRVDAHPLTRLDRSSFYFSYLRIGQGPASCDGYCTRPPLRGICLQSTKALGSAY